MKRSDILHSSVLVLPLVAALAAPAAVNTAPAVPQPPVVTYGLIRDEFGVPLAKDSKAVTRLVREAAPDGKVYSQCSVEANVFLGMNYRLSLEIDSKGPVRTSAVTVGTPMRVKALVDGVEERLSPSPVWTTPAAGTPLRRDYTLGEDSDGDGLPDEWEYWMMELNPNYGRPGQPTDLESFRPDGDCDGDGMTNLQEFYAGTDPFSKTDLFAITSFEVVPGTSVAAITFRTAFDHEYHVLMSETAGGANWSPVATSAKVDGEFAYSSYTGTGRLMTVYVDAALGSAFFKVACH